MNPEYPAFQANVSKWLAGLVVAITVSSFNYYANFKPAQDVYNMAFASFGVTAVLSGLCFGMAPSKTTEPRIRFSGEKFLHSSLLIGQTIIVVYAKNALLGLSIIRDHLVITRIITAFFFFVIFNVSVFAAVTWFNGFQGLNKELWDRYKKRVDTKQKPN